MEFSKVALDHTPIDWQSRSYGFNPSSTILLSSA